MNLPSINLPGWIDKAACVGRDPELFHPEQGNPSNEARAICGGCDVSTLCLSYCLDFEATHPGSRWGVYAGTTPRQRRNLVAAQRKGQV